MGYIVKANFYDKTNNRKLYKAGDSYTHENEERISFLVEKGFLEEHKQPPQTEGGIQHTGGGWYELPNGEKVQGKEEALQALAELESGE